MDFFILLGIIVVCVVIMFLPTGKCPRCGGKLRHHHYDGSIGRNVYKCVDCGKEYV